MVVDLESATLSDRCLDDILWFPANCNFSAKAQSGFVLVPEQYLHYVSVPKGTESTPDLIKTGNANQQVFV